MASPPGVLLNTFYYYDRSTDAIRAVIETINRYKTADMNICVISLDIKSAFNNVWWPAVLAELGKTGCPPNLYERTKDILSDREISYTKNGTSIRKPYSRWCP